MNITRKLSSYTITNAIAQVVGEMREMGQDVSLSDIAAFLGCTKETAKKYATKAIWSDKLMALQKPYRPNRTMYVYALGKAGHQSFNCPAYQFAKRAVLIQRGIIE